MEKSAVFSQDPEPPSTTVATIEKPHVLVKHKRNPLIVSGSTQNGIESRQVAASFDTLKNIPECQEHDRSYTFRTQFFPQTKISDWTDWRWQIRNRICSLKELERIINLSEDERRAFTENTQMLPVAITPYFASLIDPDNPQQALRRTMVPVIRECIHAAGEDEDPLGEDRHSPLPNLVHRYPDRVLFLATSFCSSYCRYCTRSRIVCDRPKNGFNIDMWEKAITYIESKKQIRDVLLSGGDPLTMPDEKLEWLLARLRDIKHVEIIRIGTKVPMVLPQRITNNLVRTLKRYHPLWMNIHATHPDELTPEVMQACGKLADAGIPLGSQTVLLAGINDNSKTMKSLMHGLVKMRVRPYYLYQCDPIIGSSHFRTPVQKGMDIIDSLRGFTSGFAVPMFVIDAPGGGGKTPVSTQHIVGREESDMLLKNFKGDIYRYPDYQ